MRPIAGEHRPAAVQSTLERYLSAKLQMGNTKKTPKRRKRYREKINVIAVRPKNSSSEKRGTFKGSPKVNGNGKKMAEELEEVKLEKKSRRQKIFVSQENSLRRFAHCAPDQFLFTLFRVEARPRPSDHP
jgi:hypothetical protein